MSRVNKSKHVMRELDSDNFSLPKENQNIVKIVSSKGNNLHEVESSENLPNYLVSMPTKFRKNVWIKRGDYVLVEPIDEGDKVKAEIVRILTPEHKKIFDKAGIWPRKFTRKREHGDDEDMDEDDEDGDLMRNPNRQVQEQEDESESDSD